jgi:hypothetical protein
MSTLVSAGRRRLVGGLAAVLAALAAGLAPAAQAPTSSSCAISTTDRVVAIGDVHGGYGQFQAILRAAGLIDGRRRWTGGRAVFVQTGDVVDRGAESKQVIDLVRRLERDAARARGRVVALLGNHETMRILGDYRYVSEGEYAAFRTSDSQDLRERLYDLLVGDRRAQARATETEFDEQAFRTRFLEEVPLGFVEMQQAFGPEGEYGKWVRARDTMAIVNGVAFVHGGVSPAVAPLGCAEINARVRAELGTVRLNDPASLQTLVAGPDGPLWYRGLAEGAAVTAEEVDAILQAIGARAMVIGHTAGADFRIAVQHDGRVFQIDTGLLDGDFFPGGVPSALEFKDGGVTAIYLDRRETLVPPTRPPDRP